MEQYINAAMLAIQKFIAAATPVAVKAYELSMLTLQIDAVQQLLPFLLGIIASVFVLKWLAKRESSVWFQNLKPFCSYGIDQKDARVWFRTGIICTWAFQGIMWFNFLNIWLWVKLFKPELWLVHQAIEAVVTKVAK